VSQKIPNRERKRANVAVFAVHKGKMGPPKLAAFPAFEPVQQKIQKTPLPSYEAHPKRPPFLSLETGSLPATLRTFYVLVGCPGTEEQAVSESSARIRSGYLSA
jgi:hypothetical protein